MRPSSSAALVFAVALVLAPAGLLASCQGSAASPIALDATAPEPVACTELPTPDGGVVHVTGTVVEAPDPDASAPPPGSVPNALVAVEYGGLYVPYCDMARASPYYVFGAVTDANGKFEIDVKNGSLGFHGFATGYFYSRAALDTTSGAATVKIALEKMPPTQGRPKSTSVGFDKTTVAPGARVTFSATLATWDPKDPLSDEAVLVEPTRSWGLELDPPSVGKKDNFPDGLWKRSFAAPETPGTYTYWFATTTGTCVSSDNVKATLTVQ